MAGIESRTGRHGEQKVEPGPGEPHWTMYGSGRNTVEHLLSQVPRLCGHYWTVHFREASQSLGEPSSYQFSSCEDGQLRRWR